MKKEMLVDSLIEKGWYFEEDMMPAEFCSELLEEASSLSWKTAQIGSGAKRSEETSIRNDSIVWINEEDASELQKNYLQEMSSLMLTLNRELFLGLKSFECHFARYEYAGFYKKHLDQHQGSQKRIVSVIFYLNEPQSGGELVIYKKENPDEVEINIKPRAGTFVCFLSNQIYHEVLPTTGARYSLTGWFRTDVQ